LLSCKDQKLRIHTEASIKRREPAISKLASSYNKLCADISAHIKQRRAPRGAIAPIPINSSSLFKLDVDDEIWQDIGLEDDDCGPVPRWMADEKIRAGIKSLLECDRCEEETERLQRERCALQEWMFEEWQCVEEACHLAGKRMSLYCYVY
jgi:hypothetical protein